MNSIVSKRKLLEEQLASARERLDQAMREQGEACGDNCDWHDNNAYDLAVSLTETYQALVDSIKQQINGLDK